MKRYIRATTNRSYDDWDGQLDLYKGDAEFDSYIPEDKRVVDSMLQAAIYSDDPELLEDLSNDDSIEVRRKVAKNTHTGELTLSDLSVDEDELVRANVASNPNTSKYVLKQLLKDNSRMVRARAQKYLE